MRFAEGETSSIGGRNTKGALKHEYIGIENVLIL
jgi:hypothetical protein